VRASVQTRRTGHSPEFDKRSRMNLDKLNASLLQIRDHVREVLTKRRDHLLGCVPTFDEHSAVARTARVALAAIPPLNRGEPVIQFVPQEAALIALGRVVLDTPDFFDRSSHRSPNDLAVAGRARRARSRSHQSRAERRVYVHASGPESLDRVALFERG